MKKSRIFIAVGAFALAIAGAFASKANKKFTTVTTAYFNTGGGYTAILTSSCAGSILSTSGTNTFFISTQAATPSLVPLYWHDGLGYHTVKTNSF